MAQIPVPNFGQAVATPAGGVSVGQTDVSSGIQSIGGDLMNIGQRIHAEQDATKGALALATTQNAMYGAHDDVARGIQDGSIPPDQAQAELQKRFSDIAATNTQGLKTHQLDAIKVSMAQSGGALQRSIDGTVFKYNASTAAANIDALGTQLQQDAVRRGPAAAADTYDAVMQMTGGSAGFTPEQQAAKMAQFRQATTHGYYDDKSATLYAAGDQHGIAGMLETIAGGKLPDGEQLSQEQRAHLTTKLVGLNSKLLSDQNAAANEAERLRVAHENAASDAFNAAQKIVVNGQSLDQATIDSLSAVSVGTALEQRTRELLTAQPAMVSFATQPAAQRKAALDTYGREATNPALGTSPDKNAQVAGLQAVSDKANELFKDDPWSAGDKYGITRAPAMDFSDPSAVVQQLNVRMQQIGKLEAWGGQKVSPLRPAEAEQLGHTLKGMPPDQAASVLSMVGQSIGDPDRIGAVAKQLGKGMGEDASMVEATGLAMSYAGDRTNDGKLTAEMILRGEAALKNKTSLVDTAAQSGWKAQIFTQIDGAFSSQGASDSAVKAAYRIAAANGGDVDAAVKAATGGIITHGLGKIPLPVNVDESTFNKRLAAITPAMLAPQAADGNAYVAGVAMPLAKFTASLPDATLVHAGQGMYAVKAGTSYVTNKDGTRLVLRITQ